MEEFELQIISELLSSSTLNDLNISGAVDVDTLEFTGAGYFLTIKDQLFPVNRVVLDKPDIHGRLGGINVGYLAFVENSQLTLECYSYGEEVLPKHRNEGFERETT